MKSFKLTRPLLAGLAILCVTGIAGLEASARYTGKASWYKMGHRTANGERYNPMGLTAAHRTLPFGTRVRVTNLRNRRQVVVRINDRGPFVAGRIIDLSQGAARRIGLTAMGVARVRIEVVKRR